MKKRRFIFLILVFLLVTVTHDFFCHDELHDVCAPLHCAPVVADPALTVTISLGPDLWTILVPAPGPTIVPGFLSDIYHPPDFAPVT
jgi:hypothetical protein